MLISFWFILLAIILLIAISAFFSGSETALTAASRARILALGKKNKNAKLAIKLLEIQEHLIGVLLLSNNLVNILASALATSLFISLFGEIGVVWATFAMTLGVVIFAEVLPKTWAISNPDRFAVAVARPVKWLVVVFGPLARLISWIVHRILKMFNVNLDENKSVLDPHDELKSRLQILHNDGAVVKDEKDRVGGVLDLNDLDVEDVMVHRTAMESVNCDDEPAKLVDQIIASPYTRLPVWQGQADNIIGVIHAKRMLRELNANKYDVNTFDIKKTMSAPWFVPVSASLPDQLNAFLKQHEHMALVVDEYGEVEGIVTLEDILEEIVGEIADEHDETVSGLTVEVDGSVLVKGSLPIRDLNRTLEWTLPDDEAVTVAGLVIHESQMIPEEKQTFTFYGKRFIVLEKEKNRVTKIRIRTLPTETK